MRLYTAENIKPCKGISVEQDLPFFEMPKKSKFLKDLMVDNLFTHPIANGFFLLFIILGAVISAFDGSLHSILVALVAVGFAKYRLLLAFMNLYDSYHEMNSFVALTDRGVNTMMKRNGRVKYARIETMPWENVSRVCCHKDFISIKVKREYRKSTNFEIVYIWTDDISLLIKQVQHLWYKAINEKESPFYLYSPGEFDEVSDFIREKYGNFERVIHEIIPGDIHIDVVIIPPQGDNNHYTLCTIGAGAYNMQIGRDGFNQEIAGYRFQIPEQLEYMIMLPSDWPLDKDALKDEENYWPIRLLKQIARFPIVTNDWVCEGHTVEFEEGELFSPKLPYSCLMFTEPSSNIADGVDILNLSSGKSLSFMQIVPITREELAIMRSEDNSAMYERLCRDGMLDSETIYMRLRVNKDN